MAPMFCEYILITVSVLYGNKLSPSPDRKGSDRYQTERGTLDQRYFTRFPLH